MQGITRTGCLIALACTLCLGSLSANAEIYKYRDANGKWQFTDKKPESEQKTEILDYNQDESRAVSTKSAQQPIQHPPLNFSTSSPVEKTAVAVVGINTILTTGSGFFITNDGYILTNKHVVHPDTDTYAKKLAEEKEALAESKRILDIQRNNLKIAAQNIHTLEEALKIAFGQDYNIILSELKTERLRRESQQKSYKRHQASHKEQKNAYDKATNLLLTASSANLSQHFEIVLKDGSRLQALLVAASPNHDLALLKTDTHPAYFVDISNPQAVTQGTSVFAIGNPLGLNNYVTAGIIAQIDANQIYTDAQILPGNSGGPLITKDGDIIGINTAKLTNKGDVNSQGFGIAIPINVAIEEFNSKIIKPAAPEKSAE